MKLEIFSDYVCPFCRLGEPAVEKFMQQYPDIPIIRRAFELRPEPVPPLDPSEEYLQRIWDQSVQPMADRLGLRMIWPPVIPRTRLAHEATAWAHSRQSAEIMHRAIFQAYFEHGADIGQENVLIDIAERAGLDGEALRTALANHDHTSQVLDDENQAARFNFSGVPAYAADGRLLTGVATLEKLIRLVTD